MKELNFEDIVQVNGGLCCPDFGVKVSLCIDAKSAPFVANLIGDFYAGDIVGLAQFGLAITNDITLGANFNKIQIERVEILPF